MYNVTETLYTEADWPGGTGGVLTYHIVFRLSRGYKLCLSRIRTSTSLYIVRFSFILLNALEKALKSENNWTPCHFRHQKLILIRFVCHAQAVWYWPIRIELQSSDPRTQKHSNVRFNSFPSLNLPIVLEAYLWLIWIQSRHLSNLKTNVEEHRFSYFVGASTLRERLKFLATEKAQTAFLQPKKLSSQLLERMERL